MRIAIVGPFPPFRGGISDLNSALAHQLSKVHDVKGFNFTTQYPKMLFPGKTQFKTGKAALEFESERCLSSVNPLTWTKTASLIVDHDPDMVIIRYWMPFFAPAYRSIVKKIKKRSNAKIIAMCDNIIPHEKRLMDDEMTRSFFSQVDSFIVLSKKVEEELLSINPDAQYVYSPHPIYNIFNSAPEKDVARIELNINNENVILFFGLIREYKGLDILIEAVGKIKDEINDMKLLIVGECYEDKEKYLDLIKKMKITELTNTYFEFIPDDQVSTYFSAADVCVLPYKSASQSGIVQIAYHYNTPVIVSNVGGLPEIVDEGKTGFCVSPDPDSFANVIKQFFEQKKLIQFKENIINYKKRFSWEHMVSTIENILHD